MSRRDTNTAFNRLFPPTSDGICRYCRKPIPVKRNIRSKDWCSKEHRSLANQCLSWDKARRDTFNRDGGLCRVCGKSVWLDGSPEAFRYLRQHEEYRKYYTGEEQAETHHIIRIDELFRTAWMATTQEDWNTVSNEVKGYWSHKFYWMLYLDINNLLTVCTSPCHDQIHSADYRNQFKENPFKVAPTKWGGFWRRALETHKIEDYLVTVECGGVLRLGPEELRVAAPMVHAVSLRIPAPETHSVKFTQKGGAEK